MKDCLKQNITIGDSVLILSTAGVHGSNQVVEVVSLTEKMVKLKKRSGYNFSNNNFNPKGLLVVNEIIKGIK
jgi:hypothetical protein